MSWIKKLNQFSQKFDLRKNFRFSDFFPSKLSKLLRIYDFDLSNAPVKFAFLSIRKDSEVINWSIFNTSKVYDRQKKPILIRPTPIANL